jgi:hypothetical protein
MPATCLPAGRVGTARFLVLTGISRTRFFDKIRFDEVAITQFDIRLDEAGRLNMSEEAAVMYGCTRAGERVRLGVRSGRINSVLVPCDACGERIQRRSKYCPECGTPQL